MTDTPLQRAAWTWIGDNLAIFTRARVEEMAYRAKWQATFTDATDDLVFWDDVVHQLNELRLSDYTHRAEPPTED